MPVQLDTRGPCNRQQRNVRHRLTFADRVEPTRTCKVPTARGTNGTAARWREECESQTLRLRSGFDRERAELSNAA